jgi:DNA polymerase II small subunit/DNA polymerase delta subunit B
MERYRNLGGNSGVIGYEISPTSIIVQFQDGSKYLYNYTNPGVASVEKMKTLAYAGQGLNSYISTVVKKNYASKL